MSNLNFRTKIIHIINKIDPKLIGDDGFLLHLSGQQHCDLSTKFYLN